MAISCLKNDALMSETFAQCQICGEYFPVSELLQNKHTKQYKCIECQIRYETIQEKVKCGSRAALTEDEKQWLTEHKIRFKCSIPSYKKFYSVYQYNDFKYHSIWKKIQKTAIRLQDKTIFDRVMPTRVARLCYVRDENNRPVHRGDEKHIYRYSILQKVLNEVADYLIIAYELLERNDVLRYLFMRTHIIVYSTGNNIQAEFLETTDKSVDIRLKAHITLLRCLQKGLEIEECAEIARNKHNLKWKNILLK